MNTEEKNLARLRARRSASIVAAIIAGLVFLFFNTVTMVAPVWFLVVSNAVPFVLMIVFAVCAERLHRKIRKQQQGSTEPQPAPYR